MRLKLSSSKLMLKFPNGFISNLFKALNPFSKKYDNVILMDAFDLTIENEHLE